MKAKLVFLVCLVSGLFLIPSRPVQARSYYAQRFDVLINLEHNGSFIVTETIDFTFEGGPYTFVFRDLALNEVDRIEVIEAKMDGQTLPGGNLPGQVEIKAGKDPIEIRWHFQPVSDSSHTFTLTYHVFGNVRQVAGLDGLSWRAVPEEHEYSINTSTITIQYPADLSPAGTPALDGASYQVQQAPGQIVFTAKDVSKNEPLVVDVRFPQGSLIDRPPAWQALQIGRSQQTSAGFPYALAGGGGVLALVLVFIGIFRRRHLTKPELAIPSGIITSPPDDLTPAQAGFLLSNIQINIMHGFATLLDLTRQGWLQMQEMEGKGIFKSKDFLITYRKTGPGLKLHEMVFIDVLSNIHKSRPIEVKLSEIGVRFNSRLHIFAKAIRSELLESGLIQSDGLKRRSQILSAGVAFLIIGIMLGVISGFSMGIAVQRMAFWGMILLGVSVGMIIAGIILWIQANLWPILTPVGAAKRRHWISFRDYIKELISTKVELREQWLDQYLPYAAAFNLGDKWVKAYKDRGLSTVLPWVLSTSGGYADGFIVASAVNSSAASGTGGGGAGGGGGGASGAG